LPYEVAVSAIATLKTELFNRHEATPLFGNERDRALESILGNIEQTFGGESLYKTIEEKAAHLLYFIIKDYPFTDGNKRIGHKPIDMKRLVLYYYRDHSKVWALRIL